MRFSSGVVTGVVLGAAAGVMAMPMMSRRTKRKIVRTSRKMMNTAEKTLGDMMEIIK